MKTKVVENLCIGCGACMALVPDCFEVSDAGVAYVKDEADLENFEEDIKTAADNCPTGAIAVEEE